MYLKSIMAGALLFAASITNASALVWDFSFADLAGDTASGQLVTGNVGSPYQITGISGTFDGQTITGLDGAYAGADNDLYVPGPYVSYAGLSFDLGSGLYSQVNVWWDNSSNYWLDLNPPDAAGSGPDAGPLTSFTVTATPLPSTWTMLLIGLAGLGFVGYRQSKQAALPAAA